MSAETIAAGLSAVAAWIALVLAAKSLWISRKAIKIAENQEMRRRPQLKLNLRDGYFYNSASSECRIYAFLVGVSNISDSDNAVALIELQIIYEVGGGIDVTMKLQVDDQVLANEHAGNTARNLTIPSPVPAHQTISGWCHFRLDRNVVKDLGSIRRYIIAVTDSHGGEATVEPVLVREHSNEVGVGKRKT